MGDLQTIKNLTHEKEHLAKIIQNRKDEVERIKDVNVQADLDSWNKQITDLDKQIAEEVAK
jgi:hypothetical protein